jgi:hypothetical protein
MGEDRYTHTEADAGRWDRTHTTAPPADQRVGGGAVSVPVVVDRDTLQHEIARLIGSPAIGITDHLIDSGTVRTLADALREIKTHNSTPVTSENLRWAAKHEALARSWILDVLDGLADHLDGRADT